ARVAVAAAATGAAARLAAGAVARGIGEASQGALLLQVAAGVGAGLLVFGALALIFRLEEVDMVREALGGRRRR
ncbi:MAG TPA: hypothetical protein VNO17_04480, partial [Actinomycetota bacterium]|nr:hypothetical protein [Actinomycetota bacterium]